jgi:hypothetical protein
MQRQASVSAGSYLQADFRSSRVSRYNGIEPTSGVVDLISWLNHGTPLTVRSLWGSSGAFYAIVFRHLNISDHSEVLVIMYTNLEPR